MVESKASDLHLSSDMPPLVRKDGHMEPLDPGMGALTPEDVMALLEPIIPENNRAEFDRRHDTDFAYEIKGLARFRANMFLDRKGPWRGVSRHPGQDPHRRATGAVAAHPAVVQADQGAGAGHGADRVGEVHDAVRDDRLHQRDRTDHIITIEDPIEFVHENQSCLINQREVGTHTGGFKDALRAAMREDPDIILVGELRDLETVAIAIETAETGHLVFGTLHTTTAASTVDRVIDQFPTEQQAQIRIMLSESLKGVIAQNLCRKIGGGRVAALEVLLINSAISNLIREAQDLPDSVDDAGGPSPGHGRAQRRPDGIGHEEAGRTAGGVPEGGG